MDPTNRIAVDSDIRFIKEIREFGGDSLKKCFQCATCSVVCSLSPEDNAFPRKEMLWSSWGLKEKLIGDADIWLCHGCMDCSRQCPRGARPADVMSSLRSYIYRIFAIPSFMGKALSSPIYLPWLMLVPIILIFILLLITQNGNLSHINWQPHQYKYMDFIAHGPIELLFIAGNILVFALAYIGFKNYWTAMKNHVPDRKIKKKFSQSLIEIFIEFLAHKKFEKCPTNSARKYGHLLVFYGFVGAMLATAIVVVNIFGSKLGFFPEFLPENMNVPLYLLGGIDFTSNKQVIEFIGLITKFIGLLAGTFIIIGGLILLLNRRQTQQREGISTYSDLLFLWLLWGVALTGMLCVLFRLLQLPIMGYPIYFIHLILVFFLLWYMPYSKFAHIIYRFLGLIHLKMYGRDVKPVIFKNGYKQNYHKYKVPVSPKEIIDDKNVDTSARQKVIV